MKTTKILSIFLAAIMLVACFAGCTGGQTANTSSGGNNTSSSMSDFSSGQITSDPNASSGDFDDNSSNSDPGQIPGGNTSDNQQGGDNLGDGDQTIQGTPSEFDTPDNFAYTFQGDTYIYGITEGGNEYIAMVNPDGSYTDVLSGAGKFFLAAQIGQVARARDVYDYQRTIVNGRVAMIVTYNTFGVEAFNAQMKTTYVFYDNYIDVKAQALYNSPSTNLTNAYVDRAFTNNVEWATPVKNWDYDWYYPENNDYPYREVEAYITEHTVKNGGTIYTFTKGKNIPDRYWDLFVRYPNTSIPVFLNTDEPVYGVDYIAEYSMVFANSKVDKDQGKYHARFLARNSNFAAGITPTEANDDFSTIFQRDEVTLNMNVSSLVKSDVTFSARYELYDYYGNMIDSGLYIDSTVFAGLEANRKITVSAKKTGYGIYFLNFLVITERYAYREYYPFILLDDHEYKYGSSNMWGINQITQTSSMDALSIIKKIGLCGTRGGPWFETDAEKVDDNLKVLEELKQLNFKHTPHGGWNDQKEQLYGAYGDRFIMGNEQNLAAINGGNLNEIWANYEKQFLIPQISLANKYNKKVALAGNAGAWGPWFDKLFENGYWRSDIIHSIHTYSMNNAIPDAIDGQQMWNVESGMLRTKAAIDRHGPITWEINEMGYSCVPSNNYVDPRTKADYNARCYVLASAYGCYKASTYCWSDVASGGIGAVDTDMEYHFGAFHFPDYYNVLMPKPEVIGFATLTRQLESMKSCVESSKYSDGLSNEGDKTRVFEFDTEVYGKVLVAWTNYYKQPNATGYSRTPLFQWERDKVWGNTYVDLVVDTDNSYVTVVDLNGKETKVEASGGKATVKVSGSLVFIRGAK